MCLLCRHKHREGPVSQPPSLCPQGMLEHGGQGSLNHLAPASPLFWHVGLSQSDFEEYFYQLFPSCAKKRFLVNNVSFLPEPSSRGCFPPCRPGQRVPPLVPGCTHPSGVTPSCPVGPAGAVEPPHPRAASGKRQWLLIFRAGLSMFGASPTGTGASQKRFPVALCLPQSS